MQADADHDHNHARTLERKAVRFALWRFLKSSPDVPCAETVSRATGVPEERVIRVARYAGYDLAKPLVRDGYDEDDEDDFDPGEVVPVDVELRRRGFA